MMYSGGYVVSIVSNGKILDELKDGTVALQFGNQYSIRIRNKNSWRCVAKIFIDDENVSDSGYIVNAYQTVDIERYNSIARKFKLMPATSGAAKSEGKGVRNDGANGVIRVEFYKENTYTPPVVSIPVIPYPEPIKPIEPWPSNPWKRRPTIIMTNSVSPAKEFISGGCCFGFSDEQSVTVKGDTSNQSFSYSHIDIEPEATIIQLKLVGQHEPLQARVEYCANCGKKIGRNDNFCSVCGRRI